MTGALGDRLREQADYCQEAGSPLTAAVLTAAAADLEAGGPVGALLAPFAADPPGSALPLRFTGALHRLVLERRAPLLAVHYPSVGGTPGDVGPAAVRTVEEHAATLPALVARPVQTNEVGRSSALLGGLLAVQRATGLPVRLLELGASGGLNLLVDRYAHEVAPGVVLGDPGSPVRLVQPWHGRPPSYDAVQVVDRLGCDPDPLDPSTPDGRLALTAYVWPDQVERFERLRAALGLAAGSPPHVEATPAADLLARELAEPRPGVATVVWHSVVRQYLSRQERARVGSLLDEAGARATDRAPLAHLWLEPEQTGPGSFSFRLGLTTWPGGRTAVLADCHGHGPPVVWR